MFENQNDLILIGLGLLGLFAGGEALIRGAVAIAEKLRLPKLLIGLTIIGFGTSMPELLVSLKSIQTGASNIGVGNIVGSNIANILLIACMGALIYPIATRTPGLRRDAIIMTLVTFGFTFLAWQGGISRLVGLCMVIGLVVYMVLVSVLDRGRAETEEKTQKPMPAIFALILAIGGLSGLIFGADALVIGASHIAKSYGVSDAIIGLTLVAIGTSLPELTVSVLSAIRRQNALALGNVIGSNLFNILAVLGITSSLLPLQIDKAFLSVDIPIMAASAALLAVFIIFFKKIGRLPALLGLMAYGAYMAWIATNL